MQAKGFNREPCDHQQQHRRRGFSARGGRGESIKAGAASSGGVSESRKQFSSTTYAFTSGQTEGIDIFVTNSLVQEVKRICFKARAGLNTLCIPAHDLRTGSCTINDGNKFDKKLMVVQ
jgi:hypothetical protein